MSAGEIPRGIEYDTKGKAVLPDERFKDANQLRDLCQLMIEADKRRAPLRERIDNLVNGFPTYSKAGLPKGFGWFPRVNYRESEALIAAQQSPLFDLVTEVDHCIEIDLDNEVAKASSAEELDEWQTGIAIEFTWLLFKRWRKSFNVNIPLHQREMLVHGLGYHVWPNRRWTPRTPRNGQILFPEGCPLDFEQEGKYFMLRDFVPGEDVYSFIKNEKTATNLGWYPDNVWKALVLAGKNNFNIRSTTGRREELQRRYRNGDIGYSSTTQAGLWINWVFVKEYEGGASLYAIEENITVGKDNDGYLYRKRFQFKDGWPLVIFPFDIGNGDLNSVKGYGARTKDFFELSNRIKNSMVAQVLISAFPMVKQTQPNVDPDKLSLMRLGALSRLPYGVEPALLQFPPLQNGGLALDRELRQIAESNNQGVASGVPEPKDRETKYSFMLRSQDSARVSNGLQSMYESHLQCFYDKTYRMVVNTPAGDLPHQKMANEFRKRCEKRGIPKEALSEGAIGEIREITSTGAGSAAVRLHALMTLLETIYPTTTEDRKITIERDLVSTLMGGAKVDRYARSIHDNDLPDEDESLAMQESNGLSLGGEALIGSRQNDVKHAGNHLQKAQGIVQAVQGGSMEPAQAYDALRRLLDHAGEHLARLQNNPQRQAEFKQLEAAWKEIAKFAGQLAKELQSQQEETPPEQQLSEDGRVKMAKVQLDNQVKTKKEEGNMALKVRKELFNERLQDRKIAVSMRNGAR